MAAAGSGRAQWPEPTDEAVADIEAVCRSLLVNPSDEKLLNRLKYAQTSIKDVQTRARFVAIYCLGAYAAGKPDEAEKARRFIETYSTNCHLLSALTTERYMAACQVCNGTGSVNKQCKLCLGSGRCVTCQGKGSRTGIDGALIKCAGCGGTGKCKHCGGTGEITVRCPKCAGTGKSFSKELARKAFISELQAILISGGEEPTATKAP